MLLLRLSKVGLLLLPHLQLLLLNTLHLPWRIPLVSMCPQSSHVAGLSLELLPPGEVVVLALEHLALKIVAAVVILLLPRLARRVFHL